MNRLRLLDELERDWRALVDKMPAGSPERQRMEGRLPQLQDLIAQEQDAMSRGAVAPQTFGHGDRFRVTVTKTRSGYQ